MPSGQPASIRRAPPVFPHSSPLLLADESLLQTSSTSTLQKVVARVPLSWEILHHVICLPLVISSKNVQFSSVLTPFFFGGVQLDSTGPKEKAPQRFVLPGWAQARQSRAWAGPGHGYSEIKQRSTCSFSPPLTISVICFCRSSPPFPPSQSTRTAVATWERCEMNGGVPAGGCSYQKFVHFALEQTRLRTTLVPHPSQVNFQFHPFVLYPCKLQLLLLRDLHLLVHGFSRVCFFLTKQKLILLYVCGNSCVFSTAVS